MSLFGTLTAIGTVIGNVGGAIAASVLPASIGGGAAGAGGIGAMTAATTTGTAGSALAGTAAAPAAATTALGNLAAAGQAAGTGASAVAPSGVAAGAAPNIAAGAAPNTMAGAVEAAGLTSQGAPVAGAVPASSGSGITSAGISAPGGMLPASAYPTAQGGLGGLLTGETAKSLGKEVAMQGAEQGITSGVQNMQAGAQSRANNRNVIAAIQSGEQQRKSEDEELNRKMNTLYGGLNQGRGIGMAKGGEVGLQEGQFIIPADVVSALGNGSTKAGAKFLDEFFKA